MANNENDDDIAILYEDVLSTLLKGDSTSIYDLGSLVEVYDYAYDLSDEFVTSEIMSVVLSRSSKYVPMLERKAIRLLQLSETDAAKAVASRLPVHSFVRKLVYAQITWDAENWRDSYLHLFKNVKESSISDFGALCLIDLALGVDDLNHLVMQLSEILKLLQYPTDFMADLSYTLQENRLYEQTVTVLQELTTVEPFAAEHWLKLADIYCNYLENTDEALNALEYALAIEPESANAKLLYGNILLKNNKDVDGVIKIADSLINNREYRQEALYLKAGALMQIDNKVEALKVLEKYLEDCHNPLDIFILIFSLEVGPLSESLKNKFIRSLTETGTVELEQWFDKVKLMLGHLTYRQILSYVEMSNRNDLPYGIWLNLQLYLYQSKQYGKVKTNYVNRFGTEIDAEAGLMYIMTLLRMGVTTGLKDMADDALKLIIARYKNGGPSDYVVQMTYAKACFAIHEYLDLIGDKPVDESAIDEMDPFLDECRDFIPKPD